MPGCACARSSRKCSAVASDRRAETLPQDQLLLNLKEAMQIEAACRPRQRSHSAGPQTFRPLHRQAQIWARQGINLDRSTLADWVGRAG